MVPAVWFKSKIVNAAGALPSQVAYAGVLRTSSFRRSGKRVFARRPEEKWVLLCLRATWQSHFFTFPQSALFEKVLPAGERSTIPPLEACPPRLLNGVVVLKVWEV